MVMIRPQEKKKKRKVNPACRTLAFLGGGSKFVSALMLPGNFCWIEGKKETDRAIKIDARQHNKYEHEDVT